MVKRTKAAQPAHEANHAIESRFEVAFGFVAFQVKFGHTAEAARRLMRQPLCTMLSAKKEEDFHEEW